MCELIYLLIFCTRFHVKLLVAGLAGYHIS